MIDYDMHIHTEFCGHAPNFSVESICRRADELGLDTIAITDHIFSPEGLPVITAIRAELSQIETDCRVIIGAEVDVDGRYADGRLVTENLNSVDYVIAGFHYIPTVAEYPWSPDDCTMEPDRFLELWRSSLLGVVSNPIIDTLAHPGRLVAAALDMDVYFDAALAIFEEAAKISADNQVAWEINELTGSRLNERYRQQWYRIFDIAVGAGVKLIYGSDAHSVEGLGQTDFTENVLSRLPEDSLCGPDDLLDLED